jgi:leader peptidase (prepilin peptidase)/N-methyltransferase
MVTAVLSGAIAWRFGFSLATVAGLALAWSLIALAVIDFDTHFLPDAITLPLVWVGLGLNLLGAMTDLKSAVIGAMGGYLSLWLVYWVFKLVTGRIGMGHGDFKLLAALGAFFGWQMLPLIVLLSSVVGAVIGVVLIMLARRGREVPMPFGPYLAGAGLVALFAGDALTRAYLDML